MKTDYETLKDICKKQGSALTASFKKNGDVLIYVSPNSGVDELMKSLLRVYAEILKHKAKVSE